MQREMVDLASVFNTETAMCNYLSDGDEEYVYLSIYKDLYRLAQDTVVLNVEVEGDESGVGKSTISKILTDNGFKVNKGSMTPTAEIRVSIVWMETQGTGVASSFVFAEHNTDVSFTDLKANRTVMVYYSKGKEGHQNIDSAKTRCLKKLTEELDSEFREAVQGELVYGGTQS
ncbi:MAG: hypothetical protein KBS81_07340 [Spirochaetales bacterium]|nr:hypothetical protein [Candidatus Physcosoma equi]